METSDVSGYNKSESEEYRAADFEELPDECKTVIHEAIDIVKRDFPILEKYPLDLWAYDPVGHDPNPAMTRFDVDQYGNVAFKIGFNQKVWSSLDQMYRTIRDYEMYKTNVYAEDPKGIVYHELGHILHAALALKRAGWDGVSKLTVIQRRQAGEAYSLIRQEVYLAAFTDESYKEIRNRILKEISERARDDADELIAESFSAVYGGVDIDIANKIADYITINLNK